MEEHAQEEFIVIEADTIGYPRTMVVHFEYTSVALCAMMASVRLCFVTPLANPDTSELLFLH